MNRNHPKIVSSGLTALLCIFAAISCIPRPDAESAFLDDLKQRTFQFFWDRADKTTFQIDDRYPTPRFTSIASTGFGLTAYIIGAENGFITREEGAGRVLSTFEWLWSSQQGAGETDFTGYRGFYYHFLTYGDGKRYKNVELSTVDTGLLMAGILSCQSYFDRDDPREIRIRELADSLFLRVDWHWAMDGKEWMSMGWTPENGFIKAKWTGYNEAMILLIMALGSPTHPIPDTAWNSWCKTYVWDEFYGQEHVNFSPLFGHQYSHMYIDFRGIQDGYMSLKGIDYFENARRATLANRAYCIDNPSGFRDYGESVWGLTACDGPGFSVQPYNNDSVIFYAYRARGASALEVIDDGTIAPTAAGGSIPFTPELSVDALFKMKELYDDRLYQQYGFKDAFNMTFVKEDGNRGWFDLDYIGIDQGPILIQLENHQSALVWDIMKQNQYIIRGLRKAGFHGGWLDRNASVD
ncbi:MAG: hypothetical protein JXR52_08380 [Bacteroidales bacterium]|nr:hypothetical protein [Bacteroidales bacterium]MBN2698828.1 hypothetical protein [Bacteroidales bacterium]